MPEEKAVARMSKLEILDLLASDGFDVRPSQAHEVAETIQLAARAGCLLWSDTQVVSTLRLRPLHLTKTQA